ncbi:MAG: TIGR02281 family clan AA aspartic protease, partial [Nitrospinae bacterium]|nr:TIGR02281 family clan AA aspartic protease [Nitrospinota bacterium]
SASFSEAEIYSWKDESGKIHFTDNPANIPAKYRRGEEKGLRTIKEAPPVTGQSSGSPHPGVRFNSSKEYKIPLILTDNGNFLVETILNGKVKARLMLDTGASLVTFSSEIARKLGLDPNGDLPGLPFQTAGGVTWMPLIALDTVQIGDAEVKTVEASVGIELTGMDGLLGMSFFDNFKMEINRAKSELVLRPMAEAGEQVWDGKPALWWKSKFNYYTTRLKQYKSNSAQIKSLSREEARTLKQTVRFYEDLYRKLSLSAAAYGVPKKYRTSP